MHYKTLAKQGFWVLFIECVFFVYVDSKDIIKRMGIENK